MPAVFECVYILTCASSTNILLSCFCCFQLLLYLGDALFFPLVHIMPTPYSHCRSKNLVCRIDLESDRCCECVRMAQKCSRWVIKQGSDYLTKLRKWAEEELGRAENEEERIVRVSGTARIASR
jgi:hypothetical protein